MAASHPAPAAPRTFRHRIPVLTSRFSYADRHVLFGHAMLFGDRIELVGWGLGGRVMDVVPLEHLVSMDYHPLEDGSNLTLETADGARFDLCVDDAHAWREAFERWLDYQVLASAKLIAEVDKAAALAG